MAGQKTVMVGYVCINFKMKIHGAEMYGVCSQFVYIREVGQEGGGRDWIDLAQDRDRWRDHVNEVMNLRVT